MYDVKNLCLKQTNEIRPAEWRPSTRQEEPKSVSVLFSEVIVSRASWREEFSTGVR